MQDCSESRSSKMFVWFGFSSSKLLTTLKIQVYFEMITLWAVSNLGQVGFHEILSSIRGTSLVPRTCSHSKCCEYLWEKLS